MAESNGTRAHNQAIDASTDYLRNAVRVIDEVFGKGHAKAHPELVIAFMQTCATEYPHLL